MPVDNNLQAFAKGFLKRKVLKQDKSDGQSPATIMCDMLAQIGKNDLDFLVEHQIPVTMELFANEKCAAVMDSFIDNIPLWFLPMTQLTPPDIWAEAIYEALVGQRSYLEQTITPIWVANCYMDFMAQLQKSLQEKGKQADKKT